LNISDSWHKCTNELIKFNTVFRSQEKLDKPKPIKKIDSASILQLDYTNAESLKSAELLE